MGARPIRIVAIEERTVAISRYDDPALPSGGLDTSIVAVRIDAASGPTIGYGFASIGRFGQAGLIRGRFAPRLLAAPATDLLDDDGELDPLRAWSAMMAGEKLGGHGERCVAVGALDAAFWDLAAKRAGVPLAVLLARRFGDGTIAERIETYASGGYRYPENDRERLAAELQRMAAAGYRRVKIKIGAGVLEDDLRRIEAALAVFGDGCVAVDAMNAYARADALRAADVLRPYDLRWFEDVCDPHDFRTQREVAERYSAAIAAGEALFSRQEAELLATFGGLRSDRDILVFDPVHAYGITGYLRIVRTMLEHGWRREAFWPHGGHLLALHVVAGLRLGGAEVNPFSFAPFGGLGDDDRLVDGGVAIAAAAGVGYERRARLRDLFSTLVEE